MRILLFLASNAAILVVISVVFQIFGLENILQENGVDLNLQALLLMSAIIISHVKNGDMVTMCLLQGVINTFVIFLSRIVGHVVDRVVFKTERGYETVVSESPAVGKAHRRARSRSLVRNQFLECERLFISLQVA
jgi:hypothetical protein